MTTNTAQVSPPTRQDPRQVANTLKKTVNAADLGLATGIAFDNSLPAASVILMVLVEIVVAFDNAASLTVGTVAAAYNNIVAAGDVDEATIGVYGPIMRGAGRGLTASAGVTPYVISTGAPTVGQAIITILYEGGFQS